MSNLNDDEERVHIFSEEEEEKDPYEGLSEKEIRKKKRAEKKARQEEIEKNKTPLQIVLEYVRIIAIGALIAFLLCKFVIINAVVPTSSMVPTINVDDRMIGFRMIYYFTDPQRGDVVIFKTPDPSNEGELYVKRVIGLPGETVEIRAGQVIIWDKDGNATYLEEDYLCEDPNPESNVNNATYVLGDDEYFMMGDNRNRSSDSRYWGNVSRDRILAKCGLKYYKGFGIIK